MNKRGGIRQIHALYQQNKDLISIGAYSRGSDQRIDLAIAAESAIKAFYQQGMKQVINFEESYQTMSTLASGLNQ